jgi:hypothetical protein
MSRSERTAAPRGILALRLAMLGLAALAVGAAVWAVSARRSGGAEAPRYVCPMHPEVRGDAEGTCPICSMALEAEAASSAGEPGGAALPGSTYRTYDTARRRSYGPAAPDPAWRELDGSVVATVYLDELPSPLAGARATFSSAADGAKRIFVRATAEPPVPWDASTVRVRFAPEDAAAGGSGGVGWLHFEERPRSSAVLPRGAILLDGEGAHVLVLSRDGDAITRREIQVGRTFGGVTAVPVGLRADERVLVVGAVFVDAELRSRRAEAIAVEP